MEQLLKINKSYPGYEAETLVQKIIPDKSNLQHRSKIAAGNSLLISINLYLKFGLS